MVKIQSIFKAGGELQRGIYKYINFVSGDNLIKFSRIDIPNITDIECDILILRHPINRMISQYYSRGWTHKFDEFNTEEAKSKARSKTLSEYVIGGLPFQKKIYQNIFDKSENFHIIKYEDMMKDPLAFMKFILKSVNRLDLLDIVYDNFSEEFVFDNKDYSDDISNGKSTTHKRNLDHKEYLHKFDEHEQSLMRKKIGDVLVYYDSMPNLLKSV
jgi:hypothetical protein